MNPGGALAHAVRSSGLVPAGTSGVVMVSGGADSACLAAGLVAVAGRERVTALHINYGLRPDSGSDERAARDLCGRLRIDLRVKAVRLGEGNLQDEAREARYAAAEALRVDIDGEWVATGHTRTDLAETVLYRLVTSPGRRALLGLPARRGHLIRPLLSLTRKETRALALSNDLPFHDDPSNDDPGYARNKIRGAVLPPLREINPAAEATIAATRAELQEESDALEALADELLEAAGVVPGAEAVPVTPLVQAPMAIRRIAMRAIAERVCGRPVALPPDRFAELWRLAQTPEGGEVDLGGGAVARAESGVIRIVRGSVEPLGPAALAVPGTARFGEWEVSAVWGKPVFPPDGPDEALLDPDLLADELVVRPWSDGDRMRPLGLDGTKSLQDLFTEHRVPRSLRRTLPVVISGDTIAWVAGVAVSEDLRARDGRTVTLRARLLH